METVVSSSRLPCPNRDKISEHFGIIAEPGFVDNLREKTWAAKIRDGKFCRPFQLALAKVYLLVAAAAYMGSVKFI